MVRKWKWSLLARDRVLADQGPGVYSEDPHFLPTFVALCLMSVGTAGYGLRVSVLVSLGF